MTGMSKRTYLFWLGLEKGIYQAKEAFHQGELKLELSSGHFPRFFQIFIF
jgi:hypothetical protein